MYKENVLTGFTIVLCTYNGVTRLEPTLKHLAALELPDKLAIELIVVNNASTDDTKAFVIDKWRELGEPFVISIIDESKPGKGFAIETGYDAARYAFIVTVDDDNWLHSDYLINSYKIISEDPDIGILQAQSNAVFETSPPKWIEKFNRAFIIGSPIKETGYFADNNCWVWGAGMVIKNEDWRYLRSLGFTALTSKLPGKAAGEDNEVAIAMLLLGKKIFYSENLKYQHFMPSERVNLKKLKSQYKTFGYVTYYLFLYALIIEAHKRGNLLDKATIVKKVKNLWLKRFYNFTFKQHLAYWVVPENILARQKPQQMPFYFELIKNYSFMKWSNNLSRKADDDLEKIHTWILPLLKQDPNRLSLIDSF